MEAVEGWILDVYPKDGGMVVWIKRIDGGTARLTDSWRNAIYVSCSQPEGLARLAEWAEHRYLVSSCEYVLRRVNVFDYGKQQVLKLVLKDADRAERLAKEVEQLDSKNRFTIFNADLMPAQVYFFEKDLFPLARVRAERVGESIRWELLDSVMSEDYTLPPLTKATIQVRVGASGRIPKFSDPIGSITVRTSEGAIEIRDGSERQKILSLVDAVAKVDPDIVFVEKGDGFTTHYLAERAWRNGIQERLVLSREKVPINRLAKRGTSYMAYGRVLHTPTSHRLYGRINLDAENYFVFSECGLDGLFEIARLCRMPLHKGSRASIGKCLSSLQGYIAFKEDLLVPWKPSRAEIPKTAKTLLVGDRGGFIYEPRVGLHENVGEIDFTSLFPFIITKFNISAETILCSCCPESGTRVPDVGFRICEKRKGLIPTSLEPILTKRVDYKRMKKEARDGNLRRTYSSRVDALKGILVCCLTGDTQVLVKKDGRTQCAKIGELVDGMVGEREGIIDCPPGLSVAGIDRNLRTGFCQVQKLIRVARCNKILRIVLETGRELTVTEDHPMFVLKDGRLVTRAAWLVRKGDLIPVAKRLPGIAKERSSIDLHSRESARRLYCVNFVGPETHLPVPGPKLDGLRATNCAHLPCKAIPAGESGLPESAIATRMVKKSRLRLKSSVCSGRVASAIERMDAKTLGEGRREARDDLWKLVEGDLGFMRVREVVELERDDKFVYCFQISDGEVPGFFAGEGAVYTHNCFGYLSYRNAKFGLIDCHVAVCAHARQILLETARIAESRGFEVVHGIVDSLWVKKSGATKEDFEELRSEIQKTIGLPLSFDGIYRWIAFLPSRMHDDVPVLNRYFGIFEDGSMKVRGIELRRRDSIKVVTDCQEELLRLFSRGRDLEETRKLIPEAVRVVGSYAERIRRGEVSLTDLVILNALSKNHDQYGSNLVQVSAISQLAEEGLELMAGQSVSYVITDYGSRVQRERVKPVELIDGETRYDRDRYVEFLFKGAAAILQPFGVDEVALREAVDSAGGRQTLLSAWARSEMSP